MPNPNPILQGPAIHPGWMKKVSASELAIQRLEARVAALEKELVALKQAKFSPAPPQPVMFAPTEPLKRGPGRPRKNPVEA